MSRLVALVSVCALLGPESALAQLSSPLASPRVTSHVSHTSGGRTVNYACTPISRRGHRGTDFGVGIGATVYAAAAGTVTSVVDGCSNHGSLSSRCGGGFGNHVVVSHEGGRSTIYAHLSPGSIRVRRGQRIECGAEIGLSGNSGRSTGPHLHFEVRTGGAATDPYGGPCSTQAHHLWSSGASPSRSCTAMRGLRDDSAFVRAAYSDSVWAEPGQEFTQRWTLRNSGSTTWTRAGGYRLEHTGGPTLDGLRRMDVASDVAPGATIEFAATVRAPSEPGTYTATYRMRSDASPGFGTTVVIRLRVPHRSRTCPSRTLGREVASGECVQVNGRACGAASCAWMRCADGAWQCAGVESCGGARHPHAGCERAPEMECRGPAEPCAIAGECCGGLLCALGAAGARQCCAGPEMPCENDGDCCGQMRCGAAGRCECVPVGQPASSTLECCGSAYRTRDGTCGYDR